ncbi:MAG TPA: tRNA epoxyqueuosine(34) reductase QueG [Terracidiphilus sp.]|jgi:epoxyqueuosine reductase
MNANSPSPASSSEALTPTDEIRGLAVNSGFAEAGVVVLPHANEPRDAARFANWIDENRAGSMQYLKRTDEAGELVRARVAIPFPWARSAIVCLSSYHSAQPRSTDPAPVDAAWIARYAWTSRMDPQRGRVPSDYHKVLLKRMKELEAKLHERYGEFEARAFVDTGPVVERSLAVAAGLGWSAKNTCLIHPKLGSYVFLSVLVTGLQVSEHGSGDRRYAPGLTVPDRCGSCTRCIEACPTDALFTPYQMDATRCISYLTIEHKGPVAPELMEKMGRQVFGCDICQDVCPWNRKAPLGADLELAPREELVNPSLEWLSSLDERAFEQTFNGSPVRRAQYRGLLRNVAIAMGNAGAGSNPRRFRERLRAWSRAADEGLRTAASWAVNKLADEGSTAENR